LFVDVHPFKSKLTLFVDCNCFLIASTVSVYSLRQILLRVQADGNTNSLRNTLYDRRSSRSDIVFHGICAETKPNLRYWFHVSWWNSAVWKPCAASLEHFVCQFSKYTSNLKGQFDFPLRTYNRNSSTSVPLQYGQSCFIDSRTS
jgi:hypothetical protein